MVKAPPPPVTERLIELLFAYPKPEPLPPQAGEVHQVRGKTTGRHPSARGHPRRQTGPATGQHRIRR